MMLACIAPIVLVLGGIYFLGWNNNYFLWAALLLCPLMHFFMMKDCHKEGEHKHGV